MSCIVRFGISHYLMFVRLFKPMQGHANTFFCIYVISICLYELVWCSNGSIKFQMLEFPSNKLGVETRRRNLMFECCFLISEYHENCSVMASFIVINHASLRHGALFAFAVQLNVVVSLLWFLLIVYYLF